MRRVFHRPRSAFLSRALSGSCPFTFATYCIIPHRLSPPRCSGPQRDPRTASALKTLTQKTEIIYTPAYLKELRLTLIICRALNELASPLSAYTFMRPHP